MSKFYGTLDDPYSSRGIATKCGHKSIKACAQSYDGSVITELKYDENDNLVVNISTNEGSSTYGDRVFRGSLKELQDCLTKYRDCRNELCLLCGKYKNEHLGSCNDCKFKKEG